MPDTLQAHLATMTRKAADELSAAFLALPEDKRVWNPNNKARSALDQMAECAILNGYTATLIETQKWDAANMDAFMQAKSSLVAEGWEACTALLEENTSKVIVAIGAAPDDALSVKIQMPWGAQMMSEIIAYPFWNMTYHQGQIYYIGSMLA
jgi:hypothetical protein